MRKRQTLSQLATTQLRSAQAFENLRDDPDTADEIRAMTPDEFAEWRGIEVINNPTKRRSNKMAAQKTAAATRLADIKQENMELTEENERLRSLLTGLADSIDEELGLDEHDDADDDDFDDEE